jgi:ABC-2 type transport system permease protein
MTNTKNTYRKISQWPGYAAMAWYAFRAQTRNPMTFAFGFLFPIVFISIFGLIGNSSAALNVGIPNDTNTNNPIIQTVQNQKFIKVHDGQETVLETQLRQGKLDGILQVTQGTNPQQYQVKILTSSASPQQAGTLTSFIKGVADETNLRMAGITNPPITIRQQEVSGRQFRYIDFALPGMIGFSLLSTAMFGTVFGLIFLKKALVLKRMFATPTKPLTILAAQGTSRLAMALLQTLLILGIGVIAFKFYLPHGIITLGELLLLSIFGLIAFLGFGYFMAGLANDENSAGPLTNLITLPQFLLSGTFFPTDNLPNWVQPIANNLPLSYFNIAIRKITIEGQSLESTLPYMLGLLAWGAVMYLLAARTFRWE